MIKLHCKDARDGHRCGLEYLTIQNGCVMLVSIHNGERHVNYITLSDLQQLVEKDKKDREPVLRLA